MHLCIPLARLCLPVFELILIHPVLFPWVCRMRSKCRTTVGRSSNFRTQSGVNEGELTSAAITAVLDITHRPSNVVTTRKGCPSSPLARRAIRRWEVPVSQRSSLHRVAPRAVLKLYRRAEPYVRRRGWRHAPAANTPTRILEFSRGGARRAGPVCVRVN